MTRLYTTRIIFLARFMLVFLSLPGLVASGQTNQLTMFGTVTVRNHKPTTDTTKGIGLFSDFYWRVQITRPDGSKLDYTTTRLDTICENIKYLHLTSDFKIAPPLLHTVYALVYKTEGSLQIRFNDENEVTTGIFAPPHNKLAARLSQENFSCLTLHDTLLHIDVVCIPGHQAWRVPFGLWLNYPSTAYKRQAEVTKEKIGDMSDGYFYFSFGIVFLIFFIFHQKRSENIFFSLFCLFISGSTLLTYYNDVTLTDICKLMPIVAIEFLNQFFSTVLKNKPRSKVHLIVVLCICLFMYLPFVRFGYTNMDLIGTDRYLWVSLQTLLYFYEGLFAFIYLIQGIQQKRWEAKIIARTILSVTALLIITLIAYIVAVGMNSSAGKTDNFEEIPQFEIFIFFGNLFTLIFPIAAAIVLGRRNGLDQTQLLEQINSIRKLSAENLEKEKEKKEMLERQNTELEQKVKERTAEVMHQKEEIETKSRELTDNLNYAQRIQTAILPSITLIYNTLRQSFILFYPKDIVSGDFYAFAEKNGRVLIVAGDCTGHGVSGAFMSMIGSSIINQIINEKGIVAPAEILELLNTAVIDSLRQTENESHDGMDISICSFDLATNELWYAGANRPLWLIRNKEILVFRPDKFPIGGLQMGRHRQYTNHTIHLQENDTVYIFSDGYADQFGGEHGKKITTTRFKEALLSIQHLDMRAQEAWLNRYLKNWMGHHEQVDDILVVGIRV